MADKKSLVESNNKCKIKESARRICFLEHQNQVFLLVFD